MSDLSLGGGGIPANWSYPSPIYIDGSYQSDGMIWTGKKAATEADIEALKNSDAGPNVKIDERSLSGIYSWRWRTFAEEVMFLRGTPPTSRMGGLGSQNYENQLVGESQGALFRKESDGPMWYTDSKGNLVYAVPPKNAGCYHRKYVGDGYYDAVEGVEQGSPADKILGKGEFYWDEQRRLYDVK